MGESDMRGDRPEKLAFDFKETLSKASDMHLSEYQIRVYGNYIIQLKKGIFE